MKKELNILTACAVVWCAGIVAAPFFSGTLFSDLLYRFYSSVCHQFGSRSFHFHGGALAVCIRCCAIYAGFLTGLVVVRFAGRRHMMRYQEMTILFVCSLPMLTDGTLSLLSIHASTTLSRIVTGSVFGMGMALLLHHTLTGIIHSFITNRKKSYGFETR